MKANLHTIYSPLIFISFLLISLNLHAAPATPNTPIASDGTYTDRVAISWSAVTGATSYKVYRCTNTTTTTCAQIGAPSITNYNDTNSNPGIVYYYRVKASNSTGDSAFSNYDSGYRALTAPATPVASDGTYTDKVTITWSSVTGATLYKVYRCTNTTTTTCTQIGTPSVTYFNDTSASQGIIYYYRVKASSTAGDSAYSNYDSGYRTLTAPATPIASDGTYTDKVTITWITVTGATA